MQKKIDGIGDHHANLVKHGKKDNIFFVNIFSKKHIHKILFGICLLKLSSLNYTPEIIMYFSTFVL